jgi:RNA polymerase sigma-70 factor (TIGR02943 family)
LADRNEKTTLEPASWVKSFGDYLFSYALLKIGDRDTASDLVQETFVSAIRGKDTFHGDSSEKTWLMAILKNKIIDHYLKKDVLKNASEYISETEADFSAHFFERANGHWLSDAAPQFWAESADSAINKTEFESILQMCVQKMPSKLIPVFVAKFMDDEDSETICKVHGISSSNYWVIIHRAKVLIRSCLEKNWFLTKMQK